jgi:hypothetical protein
VIVGLLPNRRHTTAVPPRSDSWPAKKSLCSPAASLIQSGRILKKSASLSCSFGLFGLSSLSRLIGLFGLSCLFG